MPEFKDYRIIVDTPAVSAGLGFDAIAAALAQTIATSRPRFAIGIFGPWGSGKTTLMDAVRGKLSVLSSVTVEFSAWRYEKEEHLLIPLLDTIREALVEWSQEYDKAIGLAQPEKARDVKAAVRTAATTVGRVITALVAGVSLKVGLPGALELSFAANDALAKAKEVGAEPPAPEGTRLQKQIARRADPGFPQSVYHACFRELKDAFTALRDRFSTISGAAHSDLRFVIFVDDLDRCLPQGALEVLEAIKLFFEMEGFVFVVGLDRSIVERFIEQRYAETQTWTTLAAPGGTGVTAIPEKRPPLVSGGDYVKKIFQVPYTLAPVQLSQLDDLLVAIINEGGLPAAQAQDLNERVQRHLRVALSEVSVNPREVKRYINSYVMQMKIRPHLNPDAVLALQTIAARSDWEKVNQALAVYREEFLRTLHNAIVSNDLGSVGALDPDLATLPASFVEYVSSGGAGATLLAEAPRIVEYLSSVEATTSTHGAVLLDVLPLLLMARNEVEKAPEGDAVVAFDRASQALSNARRLLGNIESFPAISTFTQELSSVIQDVYSPSQSSLDPNQDVKDKARKNASQINALIQRVRALRRSERLGADQLA